MTAPAKQDTLPGNDLEISPQLVEKFINMVSVIPDLEMNGGQDRIIEMILNADTVEGLEKPWTDRGFPVGVIVQVTNIAKMPSDFPGGLPFYLACECVDLETGEQVVYTTGGTSATVQLTAAYCNEWLPITVKLVKAEKPSKNGFFPEHLEIISTSANGKGRKSRG